MAGRVARGDVRLYQFAAPDKTWPVVVLTRNSALGYMGTATVAPVTSAVRGVPSEVRLDENDGLKVACAVNIHNIVTVPQDKLGRRVSQLSSRRMGEICAAIRFCFGCDGSD